MLVRTSLLILFFQMLTNVKWMKAAARGTVATPLAATTASVLKAVGWGQMAKHVTVRWTSGCSWCAQTQTDCSRLSAQLRLPVLFDCFFNVRMKMNLPCVLDACYTTNKHKISFFPLLFFLLCASSLFTFFYTSGCLHRSCDSRLAGHSSCGLL